MNICEKCSNYEKGRRYCKWWDEIEAPHSMCAGFSPMTNADHIRVMSDEELCEWLFDFTMEAFTAGVMKIGSAMMTKEQRMDWLKKPVDEED